MFCSFEKLNFIHFDPATQFPEFFNTSSSSNYIYSPRYMNKQTEVLCYHAGNPF
jgi:hypothetical protein